MASLIPKPRGRPPKNKQWDPVSGVWIDKQPMEKKRRRVEESESATEEGGFRCVAAAAASSSSSASSASSIRSSSLPPLLPRDFKYLLLDIEGCTTSIAFVHDELFPYAREHVAAFAATLSAERRETYEVALRTDVCSLSPEMRGTVFPEISWADGPSLEESAALLTLEACVAGLMSHDVKAPGLKSLQGDIWKDGYASGALKGHVYADTVAALRWCHERGVLCSIYSSGSVGAQKLLFGNTAEGDLLPLLGGRHFDITTSGPKKEAASYLAIAKSLGVAPSDLVFASDSESELIAAQSAGIGCPVMTVRPGNAPLTPAAAPFPQIESLLQLCGCD